MQEEEFQKKLHSLQVGCIIFGVFEVISLATTLNAVVTGKEGIGSLLLNILMILDLVGMYYYTSQKKPLGPILEYIFGVLLIYSGIMFCVSIFLAILGIIFIILGVGVLKEANWFQHYINSATNNVNANPNVVNAPNAGVSPNPNPNAYINPNAGVNPNPNPNAYTNPNAGVNPNPTPNAYTNPNAGVNPNPNPSAYTNPNAGVNPNPNLNAYTNPNAGFNPNSNSNAYTNPNMNNGFVNPNQNNMDNNNPNNQNQ